jgi:hypothetical protein
MKILPLISILFFSVACGNTNKEMYMNDMNAEIAMDFEAPATMQSSPQAIETEQIAKKIIKTGGINFQSENIEKDYKAIRELLPKYNAYIENENQSKSDQQINYTLTIRVPSLVYDSLYSSISTIAFRLDNKYSNIEDVTERYYDLKLRIKNKKALEQRYIDLLNKATAVKDILEIERNLNEIRTEIEGLEGQFNYLSKQVNFSTINLSFYEVLPYVYDSSPRKGFWARILSSLDNGWQGFLTFLVGFTALWPFIFLLIGGIYLFRKIRSKWKKKK